jgi:hypothetical protein
MLHQSAEGAKEAHSISTHSACWATAVLISAYGQKYPIYCDEDSTKPTTVKFKTKSGKTVSFRALKTYKKKEPVHFRAKRK